MVDAQGMIEKIVGSVEGLEELAIAGVAARQIA